MAGGTRGTTVVPWITALHTTWECVRYAKKKHQ
jgi:hypothetical protein